MLSLLSDKGYREPAECVITIGRDQQEMTELYPFLTEVSVDVTRQQAATATLKFESRRDEKGQWAVQDAGILRDWEPITIAAAFGQVTEEIMRGYIRQVKPNYPADGNATVVVECQDSSIALDRLHKRIVWGGDAPTSDSEMLSTILAQHPNLQPYHHNGVSNGSGQSGLVIHQDSTDASFLRARARANGYELIFAEGAVYFGPWRVDAEPQTTIMVYAGNATNCTQFSAGTNGHQPDSVVAQQAEDNGTGVVAQTVTSSLPLMGTESAAQAAQGMDDFSWIMKSSGGQSAEAMQHAAQSKANELAMKIKAEGELDGTLYGHVLRVAEPVGVDGVGDWMGGIYYVDKVAHRFSAAGYQQSFTLLRNAYGLSLIHI